MSDTKSPADEPAHDILAAEAFAVPAPDPSLHRHRPVVLPEDPTGIAEPHDVLAAEEFAMPAARLPSERSVPTPSESRRRIGVATVAALGLLVARRLMRRR